jgi:DNA-binding SARP family transcriptional activator
MPTLHIRLLGSFHILYGEAPVPGVDSPRLQALLAYLLLHRDAPQPRAHLSYLFWLDSTESQARANLRKYLHHLRRSLLDADRFLYVDNRVVYWQPAAPFTLDVADFEAAVDRAEEAEQAGNQVGLREALEQAVATYHGDLLPSCYDDWVLTERERLRQTFARTVQRLIELLETQRSYSAAIREAERLLRHDPLHEETHRQLMRLYALKGDRARALRAYHTCATVLERELAVEPSAATREAYERLLRLDAAPGPPLREPTPTTELVGREAEWAQLQAAWRGASDGRPRLVLLQGEAGIGKTRLAEDLLAWSMRQGIATAGSRCYASDGRLAYGPVTAWLRSPSLRESLASLDEVWLSEIARLLPELLVEHPGISPPTHLTEGWQRQRFFRALARPFLESCPLLLMIDDVQWCDGETLEWLSHLLHAQREDAADRRSFRLLLVVTQRTEEAPGPKRLGTLLDDLRRTGQLDEIELQPLDETETFTLASNVAGRALDPSLAGPLYRGSEGNPLFVVEMVRAGRARNGAWLAAHGAESAATTLPLPPRVQRVIEARLAQLAAPAHELVEVAAVVGREFTFDVVAHASKAQAGADAQETLVRSLDELWRRRIVREQGADAYDFAHDRIREVAYTGLSAARRRLLHHRVAEAIEAVQGDNVGTVAGQVAAHYEKAGLLELASRYYERGADHARRIYANNDAIDYLQRAIELLPLVGADDHQAAQLHQQLGDVLALTGEHEKGRQAYQSAIRYTREMENLWRSHLMCEVANTYRSQHRYEEAGSTYDAAMQQLGSEPADSTSTWWQAWLEIQLARADMLYFQSELPEMASLCQEVETIVTTHGSARQQSDYYHTLVMLDNRLGRFRPSAQTLAHSRRALELARETGDQRLIASKLFSLGFSLLWQGDLKSSTTHLQTVLAQAERTGELALQDRCLAYLSINHRMAGSADRARTCVEQGLEVALAEQNPFYIGVARANLAWLGHRAGELDDVVRDASAALDRWRPLAYPFEWLARWPLLAVFLSQGQTARAIDQARAMLVPIQQRLPDVLTTALEAALQAWDEGLAESARERLLDAVALAQQMGYL